MRWKISGTGKSGNSLRKWTFDLFKSSRALRNKSGTVYSNEATYGGQGDITTLSSHAYISSSKRMREVEAEKAIMVNVSRHPRWVAGGPH